MSISTLRIQSRRLFLVENACKFSPPNSQLLISVQPAESGGCVTQLTNTGPGFPLELREKVLERY